MKKMTKKERADREQRLVEAILSGLLTFVEAKAKHWANRAHELREGLSKTAIKRAERTAHKMADERPPGFVKAMEAMQMFDEVVEKYNVPRVDADTLWGALAQFCMFQLAARTGPFYDAARYYGIVPASSPPQPEATQAVPVEIVRVRDPNCQCPRCRPRTAEELN